MSATHTNGHSELNHRIGRLILPEKLPPPINPVLIKHTEERAQAAQNRMADRITTFAGSCPSG